MIAKILLTIDDSFTSHSVQMMRFLESQNIGAILFCIGERIVKMAESGAPKEAITKGFILGNHTFTHPVMPKLGYAKQFREIMSTHDLIEAHYRKNNCIRPQELFRFPYGKNSDYGEQIAYRYHYQPPYGGTKVSWHWNSQLLDGHAISRKAIQQNVDRVIEEVASYKRHQSIVLVHDQPQNIEHGIFQLLHEKATKRGISFMTNEEITKFVCKDRPRRLA